ncbi:MAG TPA: GNAT family N-acetyltransferase [Woeseiaceae bacterium]|nr:GNAT family N-acetyltransferase [Woeseiaceae bacterium]
MPTKKLPATRVTPLRDTVRDMRLSVLSNIAEIDASAWNGVAGTRYPFLSHEFLLAAEQSGSVSAAEGWQPRHLVLHDADGSLRAAMPLYEKTHSWGEFVFDWAWANAYSRAGLDYYPKLVSAVAFTPATSFRLLRRDPGDTEAAAALIQAALELCRDLECSSLHVQFPTEDEIPLLEAAGLIVRKDCQFHWHNRSYADFDEFLAQFTSAKRKKVRRDRRHVAEAGIRFRRLSGSDLDDERWNTIYELISRTFIERGSLPYFRREFFTRLSQHLPQNILVIQAEDNGHAVAAAVFFVAPDTLYGRYWGANGDYNALHFETCYYQGIDYCIEHGIQTFEPGTQGEHKISRGFTPSATWSCHWLAHPQFFSAVDAYLEEEGQHVTRYMHAVDQHSPYRNSGGKKHDD